MRRGWTPGVDFFLGFSPERTDPGNPTYGLGNTPKIVSGLTPRCLSLVGDLYKAVAKKVVPVSSMEVAEMAKLLENTFRAVNIALVNEVAQMCEKLQLNVWEVIEAAGTKPFGYMKFYPGPGIGGHCIPLDPHYLSWKLKLLNFHSRFIDLAEDVNSFMPRYVVQRVTKELNARRRSMNGSSVLVLGVAYKKDISDVRESPALGIIEEFIAQGAVVRYVDPHVPRIEVGGRDMRSQPLTKKALESSDIVVLVTDHAAFDMDFIARHSPLLFDTRNAVSRGKAGRHVVVL